MDLYTICSYSNLNQSIVLFNSIKRNTKKVFTFSIFMIDAVPSEFKLEETEVKLIKVDELINELPEFSSLKAKYDAFELCCALKPFCANQLLKNLKENELIVYLDSDLLFYNDIKLIEDEIANESILLTPHFLTPPPDFKKISELDINNSGLYNGGFFAIKNNSDSTAFLNWWKVRTADYCHVDFLNGMFVDQIWLNHVPLFFNHVKISKNTGFNFAYWNFHERTLSENKENKTWLINDEYPLLFLHFSGYRPYRKDLISIHQLRYSFANFPLVEKLFNAYSDELTAGAKKYDLTQPERKLSQKIISKLGSFLKPGASGKAL